MPGISIAHLTKRFETSSRADEDGARKAAVDDVSLEVREGELVVLLGPSGCGKTTLMRMINRLIEPTSGQIYLGDREVHQVDVTELRRHIGYVIQQVGLFPHMTVAQNVAVVPKLLGWNKTRIRERTDELLELVDLSPREYRKRYPRQLSGGQQQRVGIARAMAADPEVMLMDEPFGAIDAITRADLQNELLQIQSKVGKTVIFVTHDVEEALKLADRIAVMRDGKVIQYDTPFDLLTKPVDDFVRSLVGAEDVFRQLSLIRVDAIMEPADGLSSNITVDGSSDVRSALSALISGGAGELTVVDSDGRPMGILSLRRVLAEGVRGGDRKEPEG